MKMGAFFRGLIGKNEEKNSVSKKLKPGDELLNYLLIGILH